MRGLGAKLCVAFLVFEFWKELWRFKVNDDVWKEFFFFFLYIYKKELWGSKVNESMYFVEQNYKL